MSYDQMVPASSKLMSPMPPSAASSRGATGAFEGLRQTSYAGGASMLSPQPSALPPPPTGARDRLLEQMAHRYAYRDEVTPQQAATLQRAGYRASQAVHGEEGLSLMTFVPLTPAAGPPVLAFRGTTPTDKRDLIADTSPRGIGVFSYYANEGLIAHHLAELSAHGLADVAGHSLGGALAQITAVLLPGLVRHVTTFQSPGLPRHLRAGMEAYNAEAAARGEAGVSADHHVVHNDRITGGVGAAMLPGTLHTYVAPKGADRHAAFPVHEAAQVGSSWSVSSTDSAQWEQATWKEVGRVAAGSSYHALAHREDAYMRHYAPLRARVVAGERIDDVLASVPKRPKARRERLRDNLTQLDAAIRRANGPADIRTAAPVCSGLDVTTRGGFVAELARRHQVLPGSTPRTPEQAMAEARRAGHVTQERPRDPITRAEAATILHRMLALRWSDTHGSTAYFSDVAPGTWPFVEAHSTRYWGIFLGTQDNRLEPHRPLALQEAYTVLDRVGDRRRHSFAEQSAHLTVPALREPSSLEPLLSAETLDADDIATARTLIAALPEAHRPEAYRRLNATVAYRNQRNNAGEVVKADHMCNVTSLAMVFDGLGVGHDGPGQYEDALATHHRDRRLAGSVFTEAGQNAIAASRGIQGARLHYGGGRNPGAVQTWFHEHVLPQLEQGAQATLSIHAYGPGHIVRVQWVEDEGVRVDDPFGQVRFERAGGRFLGYHLNSKHTERGAGTYGEANLWPWQFLAPELKYVHVFTR